MAEPDWERARKWLMNEKVTKNSAKVKSENREYEDVLTFRHNFLSGSESQEYQDGGGVVQLPEGWNRALQDDRRCDEGDSA